MTLTEGRPEAEVLLKRVKAVGRFTQRKRSYRH
jgi:hypothetical protein